MTLVDALIAGDTDLVVESVDCATHGLVVTWHRAA